MKKLIRLMPDIAELVMNKCTDMSNNPSEMTNDNVNFEVCKNLTVPKFKKLSLKKLKSNFGRNMLSFNLRVQAPFNYTISLKICSSGAI